MSNIALYKYWKDAYYNCFDIVADTLDYINVPEHNAGYFDVKNTTSEGIELSALFSNINSIIATAEENNLIVDFRLEREFLSKIETLKSQLPKATDIDDGQVIEIKDKDKLLFLISEAKDLLNFVRDVFYPLFFKDIKYVEKDYHSTLEQIKQVRDKTVIESLSAHFNKAKVELGNINNIINITFPVLIVISIVAIIDSPSISDELSNTEIIFFYLKRVSIFILLATLLRFMIVIRKECFRLEQSYLKKEVMASSFISFQEQISKMPEYQKLEKERLQSKLLEAIIDEFKKDPMKDLGDKKLSKGDKPSKIEN